MLTVTDIPVLPDAACRNTPNPEVFFPAKGAPSKHAKAICRPCPVRRACLAWALASGSEVSGIWGGLSPKQRRRLRSRTSTPADTAPSPEPRPTSAPDPAPAQPAATPAPSPVPRLYVHAHQTREPKPDRTAFARTCNVCGEKSVTTSSLTGRCGTCACLARSPEPPNEQQKTKPTRRSAPRAKPMPRPRRRVTRRDPDDLGSCEVCGLGETAAPHRAYVMDQVADPFEQPADTEPEDEAAPVPG